MRGSSPAMHGSMVIPMLHIKLSTCLVMIGLSSKVSDHQIRRNIRGGTNTLAQHGTTIEGSEEGVTPQIIENKI